MGLDTDASRWQRIQELFHAASDLDTRERTDYLDRACGDDPGLREDVDALLASLSESADLFAPLSAERARVFQLTPGPKEGERIGPYQIVRQIGRGGMGAVYAAVRSDGQYRQQVAIKLVRPDVSGAGVLARFRTERQILANLDHPNIARLLDGGITQPGAPYLVMELVDGVPIDQYCRNRNLSIRERLVLFRTVCSAVQHAHHSLLVHRDIKPSNILVTKDGVPKLLDFGIAKLLSSEGTGQNDVTRLAERPMTLDYASPEQVRGELTTTATDIFSLGVLLYELLSGQRPYETASTHPAEAQRRICEVEPVRPSAHNREVGKELDDIVAMAIRKEPKERYSSVEKLSADMQNYLDGFPVLATRGSTRYYALKFIRRHRAWVAVAISGVVVLTGFGIGMSVLAANLARERDLERKERSRAEQVSGFVTSLFKASDPFQVKGETITARRLLDTGAERVTKELQGQPSARAEVLETIALAYEHLGVLDRAEAMYRAEVGDTQAAYGSRSLQAARVLRELGEVQRQSSNLPAAEASLRSSLAIFESASPGSPDEMAHVLNNLGLVIEDEGNVVESEQLFERAVTQYSRYGQYTTELLVMKSNLGAALADLARYDEAERVMRDVLATRQRLLGEHPQVFRSMQRLSRVLFLKGNYVEAEKLERQALAKFRGMLGPEHIDVFYTSNYLAIMLQTTGRLDEAESLYRSAIATGLRILGPNHGEVVTHQANLASLLTLKGEFQEAGKLFAVSLAFLRSSEGANRKWEPQVLSQYGRFLMAQGSLDAAEPVLQEALAIRLKRLGENHPFTADSRYDLATLRARQQRCDEAISFYRQALATDRELLPKVHLQTAQHLSGLADSLRTCGRAAEAEAAAREALSIRTAVSQAFATR
jgi:tetratricopeptide (TPR) repeat protein